jgi:hypothetical protein
MVAYRSLRKPRANPILRLDAQLYPPDHLFRVELRLQSDLTDKQEPVGAKSEEQVRFLGHKAKTD